MLVVQFRGSADSGSRGQLAFGDIEVPAVFFRGLQVDLFPQDTIEVSGVVKVFLQGRDVLVDGFETFGPVAVGVSAGHDRLTARLANGNIDVCVRKSHPSGGEVVDIGSDLGYLAAVTSNRIVIQIVGGDQDEVRRFA